MNLPGRFTLATAFQPSHSTHIPFLDSSALLLEMSPQSITHLRAS